MNQLLVALFQYKAWANAGLHTALAQLDAPQHPREFQAMLRLLDHSNVVDRIFQAHLLGTRPATFSATHSEPTPGLAALCQIVGSTDAWYIQFASDISAERLRQRVQFSFTDGDKGSMSGEEMLLHVITHSSYHRGSVGQMLEDLGGASPPDSLTKFLHRHEPERRLDAPGA
jgi:uncharacterized damage-inducible protein DinB